MGVLSTGRVSEHALVADEEDAGGLYEELDEAAVVAPLPPLPAPPSIALVAMASTPGGGGRRGSGGAATGLLPTGAVPIPSPPPPVSANPLASPLLLPAAALGAGGGEGIGLGFAAAGTGAIPMARSRSSLGLLPVVAVRDRSSPYVVERQPSVGARVSMPSPKASGAVVGGGGGGGVAGGSVTDGSVGKRGGGGGGGGGDGLALLGGDEETVQPFFREYRGGLRANVVEGPGIYYVGIIDILQRYTWKKWGERFFKVHMAWANAKGLSVMEPDEYAARFRTRVISQLIEGYQSRDYAWDEEFGGAPSHHDHS